MRGTQHHTETLKYIGNPVGGVLLGSAGIGRAKVGSRWLFVSWGRNLTETQAEHLLSMGVSLVSHRTNNSESDGSPILRFEVVIPEDMAAVILSSSDLHATLFRLNRKNALPR